jgi:hypothetical protein
VDIDWELSQRIQCSEVEKHQCLQLVIQIIELAGQARRDGLLALVKDADKCRHFLLRKGLLLLVDGVEYSVVKAVMAHHVMSGNFRGKELLERCLIMEGVLAIQKGLNPKIIRELLLSFFDEGSYALFDREFEERNLEKLKTYLRQIKDTPASSPAASKIDDILVKLNDEAMEQFLKQISTAELAKAVKGMGGKAQLRIFKTLPKNSALLLSEKVEGFGDVGQPEIMEAQRKLVTIIADLKRQRSVQNPN